jgi:hypothetical protein
MLKAIPCTAKDLALAIDLGERRVSELTRVGLFRKPYDLVVCVQAYIRFLRTEPGKLTDERARLVKAQASLAEINLRARTGELVERSAVATRVFTLNRQTRDQILNVPSRVSGMCAAETDQGKIHALLTTELTQALEALTHEKYPTDAGPSAARPHRTGARDSRHPHGVGGSA